MSKWVPVALADGLKPGGVMRAVVGDQDLVVWRTTAGAVNAWNNRCPHRGMRLSFGFVRGDRLACLYHGWQFGADSVCRYIPAHPDLEPPATITATVYGARERGGLIWVSLSGEGEPDMPDIAVHPVRSLAVDVAPGDLLAALRGACFPVSETWQAGSGTFSHEDLGEAVVAIDGVDGDARCRLVAAVQPLPDGRAMLHLLVDEGPDDGPHDGPAAALKLRLSDWAERLRWFLENPQATSASWTPVLVEERAA